MLLLYKDTQAGFMASCSGFSGTKYGSAHSLTMARGFLVNGGTVAPKEASLSTLPG